jgi:hypothetical protein
VYCNDNQADEDHEVYTGVAVDKHADEADSESVERLVDTQVEERGNEMDHVASDGGNVESLSVDGDTDWSDDCLAATSNPPCTHQCKMS